MFSCVARMAVALGGLFVIVNTCGPRRLGGTPCGQAVAARNAGEFPHRLRLALAKASGRGHHSIKGGVITLRRRRRTAADRGAEVVQVSGVAHWPRQPHGFGGGRHVQAHARHAQGGVQGSGDESTHEALLLRLRWRSGFPAGGGNQPAAHGSTGHGRLGNAAWARSGTGRRRRTPGPGRHGDAGSRCKAHGGVRGRSRDRGIQRLGQHAQRQSRHPLRRGRAASPGRHPFGRGQPARRQPVRLPPACELRGGGRQGHAGCAALREAGRAVPRR